MESALLKLGKITSKYAPRCIEQNAPLSEYSKVGGTMKNRAASFRWIVLLVCLATGSPSIGGAQSVNSFDDGSSAFSKFFGTGPNAFQPGTLSGIFAGMAAGAGNKNMQEMIGTPAHRVVVSKGMTDLSKQMDARNMRPAYQAQGEIAGTLTPQFLGPYRPNAYGPGVNSDATGRPFVWKPDQGPADPFAKVRPDVFGPGIGMDQYGRAVRAACPPYQPVC
jgi:hypothetical protein